MRNSDIINRDIEGRSEEDLAEQLYDPELYEETSSGVYLSQPETTVIHRLSLTDEEWRKMVDEWGEEYGLR